AGIGTTFTAQAVGAGTIQADHDSLSAAADMIVGPGDLDQIVIEDAAGGTGSPVITHPMAAGQTLDVWAAGYDRYNNYVGNISVIWNGTGVAAGRVSPTGGIGTTFTARTAGTGTIQADHDSLSDTADMVVGPDDLDHIVIEDAAGGTGSPVTTHSMAAGQTLDVWAAGYDLYNNYVGDVSVIWSGTGVVAGRLSPTGGISATFTARTAGTGIIQADHATVTDDNTGIIDITLFGESCDCNVSPCAESITGAIAAISGPAPTVLYAAGRTFIEDISLNGGEMIVLWGGWDSGCPDHDRPYTTITSPVPNTATLTIQDATLTVENIILN
ncbi:MAG: hypothetical protein GY868_12235, partial [Deltaproteobacteria bacterium]|nr:hypothetical protein [Deltaproteobacteria bacterium]